MDWPGMWNKLYIFLYFQMWNERRRKNGIQIELKDRLTCECDKRHVITITTKEPFSTHDDAIFFRSNPIKMRSKRSDSDTNLYRKQVEWQLHSSSFVPLILNHYYGFFLSELLLIETRCNVLVMCVALVSDSEIPLLLNAFVERYILLDLRCHWDKSASFVVLAPSGWERSKWESRRSYGQKKWGGKNQQK